MDIDQLLAQSVHKVVTRGCLFCEPPDLDGFADYVGRLEHAELEQVGTVNRQATFRTIKATWDIPIGQQTVTRHFNEHL